MVYRDFQDLKLSALGMGAMRLPVVDGDDAVSYTHLDVYKRQGCNRPMKMCSRPDMAL